MRFMQPPYAANVSIASGAAGQIDFGSGNGFTKAVVSTNVDAYFTARFGATGDAAATSLSGTATASNFAFRCAAGVPITIEQIGSGRYLNLYNLGAATTNFTVTSGATNPANRGTGSP